MKPIVILNPYAGRWKGQARQSKIELELKDAGVQAVLKSTDGPGHATELAVQAVREGYFPIIAAGGDGTLNEVFNGMMQGMVHFMGHSMDHKDEPVVPFGILPVGSANDLADQLGIPRELSEAVRVIRDGKTIRIDVGQINDRYFLNNAGLGLEPYITILQSKMKKLKGNLRYIAAALEGVLHHPTWKMSLEWDKGKYDGLISLVSIGNCARTGGVFYTVPHANFCDGQLTFIHGYIPTRLKTLLALPMTMKPDKGNITEHPAVHENDTAWLKVKSETPTPAHADGEIITQGGKEFEFRILPGKLNAIVPRV